MHLCPSVLPGTHGLGHCCPSRFKGSARGQDPNLLELFIQLALDMRLAFVQRVKSRVPPGGSTVILLLMGMEMAEGGVR